MTNKRAQADGSTHYIYNTINNASSETDNLYNNNTDKWNGTKAGFYQAELVNKGGQFGYYFINEKPYLSLYAASNDPAKEEVTKEVDGQNVNLDHMLPTGGISDTAYFGTKDENDTKWLTVNGTRENNIIAWDSFSIGRGAGVEFLNHAAYKDASWNYLNYVTGKNLSEIYGKIEGHNNNIFLLNPNGIIFGENASINVGSLYASTRRVTEADLTSFETSGKLSDTYTTVGDVVNRMGSGLSGKKITLEGDNVSFPNSVLNNGNLTIGGGGKYTVKADTVTIGFEGKENREAVESAAIDESNLDTTATRRYAELIGQNDLNRITEDPTGTYMLKENVGGQALTEGIFYGTLDGAGHTVALAGESFFGGKGLKGEAEVRNLTLTGSVSERDANGSMGALVGTAIDSKIANVFNEAEVNADYAYYAGGLVGAFVNGSMKNSANRAEVSVKNNSMSMDEVTSVGGVTGVASGARFDRGYNAVAVSAANESSAGGLIGMIYDMDEATSINNSYNEGDVAGGVSGGLVAGVLSENASFRNVFNSGNVKALTNKVATDEEEIPNLAGGLVGLVSAGTASFENAYNVGAVEGKAGYVHGIGSDGSLEGAEEDINGSISSKNVYNTGTVGGESAYAYWDASGTPGKGITDQKSLAAALNGEGSTFTSSENWVKTGTDTLPLLKAYMNPLHITDKTVTYDGKEHYLYYTQDDSPSAHLKNAGDQYGRNAGTYKATITSDQLGYYMVQPKEGDHAKANPAVANQPVLTIKPADLTFIVTVPENGYSRVYDGTNKAEGVKVTMTGTVYGTDEVTPGTVAFVDANAGDNKVLKISGVEISDGNDGKNYTLVLKDGTGTITRAPLTLVADPVEVTQGAKATFTGKITGFVNNEGLAKSDKLVFTADTSADAGTNAITGMLNGDTKGNYGNNYTFDNDSANKTALTIIANSNDSGSTGSNTGGTTGSTSTPASTSTPVTETATVPQQVTQQVAQPQTANTANATAASTAQTANEAAKSLGQASHQEAASTEDAAGDKALSDAGSKGALDISSPVQHTQLDPEQIKKIVDESGADISSKAGDEVNTEHFEYGDFSDGNVGKVEH